MIVKDIAKAVGVDPHVIRYYARIGLLEPKRSPENGYKLFDRDDVRRVQFVREAQHLGLSLTEIQVLLDDPGRGSGFCRARMHAQLRHHLHQARATIAEVSELAARIEAVLPAFEMAPGCETLDHATVCPLIEAVARNTAKLKSPAVTGKPIGSPCVPSWSPLCERT